MFGSYRISQGVYKFSLQEVIRKDFIIKDGSTITFNGAPLNATLDIQAGYLVNSASLNDLVPDAGNYVNQTNIKVNCLMALTGQLTSPDIKMSLELPNERDEVQALVRNYIPTDEQMNMQILYLLGIGKFYTPENVDATGNSNMMSSVLSSTLSGQLNNALSQIIDSNNWNFGTNFSTGERGWTDMEFETMLSGQLLNNRLLINGNFGYRDNPMANTNFVGDFEAELDPVTPETAEHIHKHPAIKFMGWQEDIRPFLAAADAFVFPSYREGFPNVILQAGAMGLPCIVTNINGCNEIIENGKNGIIIPPHDSEYLYRTMCGFLSSPRLVEQLASAARPQIVQKYDRRTLWEALRKVYQEQISNLTK